MNNKFGNSLCKFVEYKVTQSRTTIIIALMGAASKHGMKEDGGFSHLSSFPQFCAVLSSFTGISRRYVRRRGKEKKKKKKENERAELSSHRGIAGSI
ncbi:hypothetical protein PUN28_010751 [Cardiocondyla obscurior]|uniref:Uncharacterized protein n=1 Tax=Cardiocondyla obscurior TaxID=286306 RepID=A0AAW2FK33_9HYME